MDDDRIIHPVKFVFWMGLAECAVFVVLAIILAILQKWEELACIGIASLVFIPMGVWLIIYQVNWQLIINEDGITFRNIFRKTKIYKYTEITAFKRYKLAFKVYIGKKVITVDYLYNEGNPIILLHKLAEMNIPTKKQLKKR